MRKIFISEISKIFNIPEHVIRFYHKKGLLPHMKTDINKYRYMLEDDIGWVKTISCLKQIGMSLSNIKYYIDLYILGDSTLNERFEMIKKQKIILSKNIQNLLVQQEWLDKKEEFYINKIKNTK